MYSAARIDVFQLGDFSGLDKRDVELRVAKDSKQFPTTGDQHLDSAVRAALSRDYPCECTIHLRVSEAWLQITVRAGSWLGGEFGRRIETAIALCERMSSALSADFPLHDPDEYTIEGNKDATFSIRTNASRT